MIKDIIVRGAAGSATSSSEDPGELLHRPTEKETLFTSVSGPTAPQVPPDPGHIFPLFGPIVKENQPEAVKERLAEAVKENQPEAVPEKQSEAVKRKSA